MQSMSHTPFPGKITPENIGEVIAFHRSSYGDLHMEIVPAEPVAPVVPVEEPVVEPVVVEPVVEVPVVEPVVPAVEPVVEEPVVEEPADGEDSKLDLPGAVSALAKVRKEAADHRTKLRALEKAMAEAKTPEQVAEITKKITDDNATETRTLLVENVALAHKLPADLASALQGKDRTELEAHAKILAKYVPATETDDPPLGGGVNPLDGPEDFDPVKAAREAKRRPY